MIKRLVLIVGLVLTAIVIAQPLSNHNELQAAMGNMYDRYFNDGCLHPDHARTDPWTVHATPDGGYKIVGVGISGRCLKTGPTTQNLTLDWAAPTAREDGAQLDTADIANYIITYEGGVILTIGSLTSHVIVDIAPGAYSFTLQTVDVAGVTSVPTAPLSIVIP